MTNLLFAWNRGDQDMGQTRIRAGIQEFSGPCFAHALLGRHRPWVWRERLAVISVE